MDGKKKKFLNTIFIIISLTYIQYIKVNVCVCVYISAIEIQTTALILMKFGMEILLNAGKVPSRFATPYPHPWGQRGPKQGLAYLCGLNR